MVGGGRGEGEAGSGGCWEDGKRKRKGRGSRPNFSRQFEAFGGLEKGCLRMNKTRGARRGKEGYTYPHVEMGRRDHRPWVAGQCGSRCISRLAGQPSGFRRDVVEKTKDDAYRDWREREREACEGVVRGCPPVDVDPLHHAPLVPCPSSLFFFPDPADGCSREPAYQYRRREKMERRPGRRGTYLPV